MTMSRNRLRTWTKVNVEDKVKDNIQVNDEAKDDVKDKVKDKVTGVNSYYVNDKINLG